MSADLLRGRSLVLAFVEFDTGVCDWLSLDGLAFYREAGRVRRSMFVTVGPFSAFPACPVMGLPGDGAGVADDL